MGLSDEERWKGLMYQIKNLTDEIEVYHKTKKSLGRKQSRGEEELEIILKECDGIWHKLLGSNTNNLHWLLGSDSSDGAIIKEGTVSPWGVVVTNTLEEAVRSKTILLEEDIDKIEREHGIDNITISGLLRYYGCLDIIFNIYKITENMAYYLRRYDDEFKSTLYELDKTISNIQGLCFKAFTAYPKQFSKAKLIRVIAGKVYGNCFAEDDPIKKWLEKINFHFRLRKSKEADLQEIINLHLELVKYYVCEGKECGLRNCKWPRLKTALQMMGPSFNHEIEHKDLFKMMENDDVLSAHLEEAKIICEGCKKGYEEEEEEEVRNGYNSLEMYSIGMLDIMDGDSRLWNDKTELKDREFDFVSWIKKPKEKEDLSK